MIERCLTPNDIVEKNYNAHGIVVFVFNEKGEVLALREKTFKPETGKKPGQLGVLCETSEGGESWKETFFRGFKEELDISDDKLNEIITYDEENSYIGECIFIPGVLARVFKVKCNGSALLENAKESDEVEIVGFIPLEKLLETDIRDGVRNVIYDARAELIGS